MTVEPGATLVLHYRPPGKYALNVLAGSLEAAPWLSAVKIVFAADTADLVAAARSSASVGIPTVVAWSSYSPGFAEIAADAARARAQLQDLPVTFVVGGVHATAEPADALQAGFDLVAVGEGEQTIRELMLRALERRPYAGVPGLVCASTPAPKPARARAVDLDPYPPFAAASGRFGAIEITRGCIYGCRFCQTPFASRAAFRHRSIERIAHWAGELRRAGRRDVRFVSPTALSYGSSDASVQHAAIEALLASVRERIGLWGRLFFGTFPSEVRPEHLDARVLSILKRYVDNDNLIVGAQSGSNRLLKETHRGHDVEVVTRAVRLGLEAGFVMNVDFILGLPGETPEDLASTLALMSALGDLGARVHGHTFMPLPGTPLRDAPAGALGPLTELALERLASQGQLYGQWKRQRTIALAMQESSPKRRTDRKRARASIIPFADE